MTTTATSKARDRAIAVLGFILGYVLVDGWRN